MRMFYSVFGSQPGVNKNRDRVKNPKVMNTDESHIACPITNACPEGMEPTNVDVHSHIHVSRYLPNPVDRLFLIQRYDLRQKASTDPEEFSEKDTNAPRVFRVACGRHKNQRLTPVTPPSLALLKSHRTLEWKQTRFPPNEHPDPVPRQRRR